MTSVNKDFTNCEKRRMVLEYTLKLVRLGEFCIKAS